MAVGQVRTRNLSVQRFQDRRFRPLSQPTMGPAHLVSTSACIITRLFYRSSVGGLIFLVKFIGRRRLIDSRTSGIIRGSRCRACVVRSIWESLGSKLHTNICLYSDFADRSRVHTWVINGPTVGSDTGYIELYVSVIGVGSNLPIVAVSVTSAAPLHFQRTLHQPSVRMGWLQTMSLRRLYPIRCRYRQQPA